MQVLAMAEDPRFGEVLGCATGFQVGGGGREGARGRAAPGNRGGAAGGEAPVGAFIGAASPTLPPNETKPNAPSPWRVYGGAAVLRPSPKRNQPHPPAAVAGSSPPQEEELKAAIKKSRVLYNRGEEYDTAFEMSGALFWGGGAVEGRPGGLIWGWDGKPKPQPKPRP